MPTRSDKAATHALFRAVSQSEEPIETIVRTMGSMSALLRDSCGPRFTSELLRAMATKMDVRQ